MSKVSMYDDIAAINRTTQEVLEKSDRVRAVLLGSQIDDLLKRLLQAYLVPKKGRRDRLLDGSGFAGTYSARVELAFRTGLVSPDWYHDLRIVGEIRDAFAHGLAGLTLNDPKLSKLCYALKMGSPPTGTDSKGHPDNDNPQTRFVGGLVVLSAHLCLARLELERVPEIWKTYKEDAVNVDTPPANDQGS